MPLPVVGWLFLVLMGVVVPWGAIVTARKLDAGMGTGMAWMSRGMFFAQVYLTQLLMLGAAVATWRLGDLQLPTDSHRSASDLLVGAAVLAVLAGSLPWRFANMRDDRRDRLDDILPHTRRELLLFYGVSLLAGIGEEIIYRGVLFVLVERLIGDWWLAALACSALFGVAHATQGWVSGVTITVFSLVFHLIVWLTGGLWVAMLVHVLYDAFAGTWCGSWRDAGSAGDGPPQGDPALPPSGSVGSGEARGL